MNPRFTLANAHRQGRWFSAARRVRGVWARDKRSARPAKIADIVVFYASEEAGYANATSVTADGGLSQSSVGL